MAMYNDNPPPSWYDVPDDWDVDDDLMVWDDDANVYTLADYQANNWRQYYGEE